MIEKNWNSRKSAILFVTVAVLLLAAVMVAGIVFSTKAMQTDFSRKNQSPSFSFLFGTDWMGRDMLSRTLAGLSLSIRIGLLTAVVSTALALLLGTAAATLGSKADAAVSWCIDLCMGIPHILLVILISLAFGKGFIGVVAGVSLSHWPSLARIVRSEVLQLRQAPYVMTAEKLGASRFSIFRRHILPHLFPQFLTGLILQFPHAILHEASVTFLGFGLPPEQPAIGVILSESMRYLTTGKWWLAVLPGLSLAAVTLLFSVTGNCLRRLLDPASAQE